MKPSRLVVIMLFVSSSPSFADTLLVPKQYPTIYEGIKNANPGDTVLVAPGTYSGPSNQDLHLFGKSITVKSESGPATCFIDCTKGSGFIMDSSETEATRVEGFTVRSSASSLFSGFVISFHARPTIVNCIIQGPYEPGFVVKNESSPVLTDCKVVGAQAGGLHSEFSTVTANNCAFSGATGTVELVYSTGYFGGCGFDSVNGAAVRTSGSAQLTLDGCSVTSDHVGIDFSGDGFSDLKVLKGSVSGCGTRGVSLAGGTAVFNSCTIESNGAGESGQGAGLWIDGTDTTLGDCYIANNSSGRLGEVGRGGGVYVKNTTASFDGCTISGNSAGRFEENTGEGGGVYVDADSDVTMTNCQIEANTVLGSADGAGSGGGVYSEGDLTLVGCSFVANTIDIIGFVDGLGGGLCATEPGSLTADGCQFQNNHGVVGGGVYVSNGTLTRCTFQGNQAGDGKIWGGGGGAWVVGPVMFERCMFRQNHAGSLTGGGAVAAESDGPYAELSLRNSILTENSAQGDGQHGEGARAGAVYMGLNSTGWILNCTFAANSTDYHGAHIGTYGNGGSIIANTIFGFVDEFELDGNLSLAYCSLTSGFSGLHNLLFDAHFEDDQFHLPAGSPCLDRGDNDQLPPDMLYDYDGLSRYFDDATNEDQGNGIPPIVDIGAQEGHHTPPKCYPDFTNDGVLDLFDFLEFINYFNKGAKEADCDANGKLDFFDFLCFTNTFNAGC